MKNKSTEKKKTVKKNKSEKEAVPPVEYWAAGASVSRFILHGAALSSAIPRGAFLGLLLTIYELAKNGEL